MLGKGTSESSLVLLYIDRHRQTKADGIQIET